MRRKRTVPFGAVLLLASSVFSELIVIRREFIKQLVNIFLQLRSVLLRFFIDQIEDIYAKCGGYFKRHAECHIRKITLAVFELLDLSLVAANC